MDLVPGETYAIINVRGWEEHTFEFERVDNGGRVRGTQIYPNGRRYRTQNFCYVAHASEYLSQIIGPSDNIPEEW